jgi:hypothetical protein
MCHRAVFEPGDDPALVRAGFACPYCLAAAGALQLVDAFALPVAELTCGACGALWQVELTLAQLAQLITGGGGGLLVGLGPQAERIRRAL